MPSTIDEEGAKASSSQYINKGGAKPSFELTKLRGAKAG